jgi:hypothetical protein
MKRTIHYLMAIALIATIFGGCKKGENDPFMSLLSRTARITGEWELTDAEWTENEDGDIYNYNFSGSTLTMTGPDGSGTATYSESATINKDGTFESEESWAYPNGGGTQVILTEGLWYFLDGSKELEVKDEERVEFLVTKQTRTYNMDGDTYTYFNEYDGKSNSSVMILLLDKLANKEMVTLLDYTYRDEDGYIYTEEGTKTYTQK